MGDRMHQPCPRCGGQDRFYRVSNPKHGGDPFWNCNQCSYKEYDCHGASSGTEYHGSSVSLAHAEEPAKPTPAPKPHYTSLAEYAQAHGLTCDDLARWGWKEAKRSGFLVFQFPTDTGNRYRYADADRAGRKYDSDTGYQNCWYGLNEAIARSGDCLVLCNGEVSTITAQSRGVAACCITGGEKSTIPPALLTELITAWGGPIILAYDCDKTGRNAALGQLAQLRAARVDVRAVDLGGSDGFDLADFCRLHDDHAAEALFSCPDLPSAAPASATNAMNLPDDTPEPWEPPLSLGRATEALPPFPTQALPGWLRAYVDAVATATQTPPDMAATLALSVVAVTCQRRTRVQIRADWSEPTNLYTLVAMPPANRKSAVFAALVRPVEAYEAEQIARVAPERASAASDLAVLEARLKDAQKDAGGRKKAESEVASQAIAQQDARDIAAEIATFRVPALPRYIVSDITPEKMASMLCEQDGRMAVLDAEGGFFDILAGRYSSGAPNIDAVLKGHAGDTLRVDRGSRPSEFITAPALTLGLAVQPAVLEGLAESPSFRGRGLLGRVLYCLPGSPVGGRSFDAPTIPPRVSSDYDSHITALLARSVEGESDVLTLSAGAMNELRILHNWLEPQLGEDGELGTLADWAGKLLGAVARIGGLLHMAQHGPAGVERQIAAPTMADAVQIGRYYLAHAQAAFGLIGADPQVAQAQKVWRAIQKDGRAIISKRNIWLIVRPMTVDELDAPIGMLVKHGYLRLSTPLPANSKGGRRPSPDYEINPLLLDLNDLNDQNSPKDTVTTFTPVGLASSDHLDHLDQAPDTHNAPDPAPDDLPSTVEECLALMAAEGFSKPLAKSKPGHELANLHEYIRRRRAARR